MQSYSDERAAQYVKLKLAGLREAPCQLAIFADPTTEVGHGLGRRTMPDMLAYSVVAAICTLWLAARAQGIGMGWVSILAPAHINKILDVPDSWRLIGYFCIGYPQTEDERPELERAGWETRQPSEALILRR